MVGDQLHHGIADAHQATRRQHGRRVLEVTVAKRGQLIAPRLDHTESGGAQTGINAQNNHKSEIRMSKSETNSKHEFQKNRLGMGVWKF
jgi:hypothetical protein